MALRKLQKDIDRTLKQISEGIQVFQDLWEKCELSEGTNLRDKCEADLKKEIKKLQRMREDVKKWEKSSDVKNKKPLQEARKVIEVEMERFKVFEKQAKMKAYSKEGLSAALRRSASDHTRDPNFKMLTWLRDTIEQFEELIEQDKEELEDLQEKAQTQLASELSDHIERHQRHAEYLADALKRLENDEIVREQIEDIKDNVEYYISSYRDTLDSELLSFTFYDVLDETPDEIEERLAERKEDEQRSLYHDQDNDHDQNDNDNDNDNDDVDDNDDRDEGDNDNDDADNDGDGGDNEYYDNDGGDTPSSLLLNLGSLKINTDIHSANSTTGSNTSARDRTRRTDIAANSNSSSTPNSSTSSSVNPSFTSSPSNITGGKSDMTSSKKHSSTLNNSTTRKQDTSTSSSVNTPSNTSVASQSSWTATGTAAVSSLSTTGVAGTAGAGVGKHGQISPVPRSSPTAAINPIATIPTSTATTTSNVSKAKLSKVTVTTGTTSTTSVTGLDAVVTNASSNDAGSQPSTVVSTTSKSTATSSTSTVNKTENTVSSHQSVWSTAASTTTTVTGPTAASTSAWSAGGVASSSAALKPTGASSHIASHTILPEAHVTISEQVSLAHQTILDSCVSYFEIGSQGNLTDDAMAHSDRFEPSWLFSPALPIESAFAPSNRHYSTQFGGHAVRLNSESLDGAYSSSKHGYASRTGTSRLSQASGKEAHKDFPRDSANAGSKTSSNSIPGSNSWFFSISTDVFNEPTTSSIPNSVSAANSGIVGTAISNKSTSQNQGPVPNTEEHTDSVTPEEDALFYSYFFHQGTAEQVAATIGLRKYGWVVRADKSIWARQRLTKPSPSTITKPIPSFIYYEFFDSNEWRIKPCTIEFYALAFEDSSSCLHWKQYPAHNANSSQQDQSSTQNSS